MSALIARASIYEIEASRNRAIDLFAQAWDLVDEAHKAARAAAPSGTFSLPTLAPSDNRHTRGRVDVLDSATKTLDRSIWSHLILATGLDTLMDKAERDAFRDQCEKDPPPATADNCFATMERLMGDRDLIFKRGIANAFSKLDRRFRSHDGFKVGARMVLSHVFGLEGWWNHHQRHDETLLDVERAFALLDGQTPPERDGGIIGAIKLAKADLAPFKAASFTAESPYFRVNVFKNGNAHIWFERPDLVDKVNLLLADYYGAALGAGADVAAKNHEPNRTPAKNFGFFETPAKVADRLLEEARVGTVDARNPAKMVLEPSAGRGALARPMLAAGHHVTCVEIQPRNADDLRALQGMNDVRCSDFFDLDPTRLGMFDAIVMNPPFDDQRDIDHVTHALRFLKPGGRLAAVMSAGVEFRDNAKARDFRAMVEARGGRFRDLPPGSFAESGTNVNTVILTIGGGRF